MSGSRTALKCADGLADVPQLPPADADIEALAARYADNLHKLDEVAPKVEKYYNQQNYKDDAMAAGRTLNTEYEPVLNALAADTRTMFGEVQKRSDGIDERRVDAIAQHDGKRLRWEANAFMLQARTTIHALDRLQSGKAPKEQVVAAVTPLEARFEEADAYAKAHPEENTDDMNLWKCAYSGAESLVTDAKKVRRAAAEGKPYDTEYVRRQYNSLVDNANVCKR